MTALLLLSIVSTRFVLVTWHYHTAAVMVHKRSANRDERYGTGDVGQADSILEAKDTIKSTLIDVMTLTKWRYGVFYPQSIFCE